MLKKLAYITTFIAYFSSHLAYAITDEEQIRQDCEFDVKEKQIVGGQEYWQAFDDCVEAQMASIKIDQDQDDNSTNPDQ